MCSSAKDPVGEVPVKLYPTEDITILCRSARTLYSCEPSITLSAMDCSNSLFTYDFLVVLGLETETKYMAIDH